MTIEMSKNGILDVKEGIIAHQVNCCNKIETDVSRAIISKYPEVEDAYHLYCNNRSKNELFGTYQMIVINNNISVVNIFSQKDYSNSSKTGVAYTDLSVLTDILKKIIKNNVQNVYVPERIGGGLAEGDWQKFMKIMNNENFYIRIKE